jgi:3-oxoacyl-[acyl-carrier protein] reductase
MGLLDGKVAIVTGAGGGFGKGIAEAFVAEGASVVVADIDGAAARAVATRLGPGASPFTCDVSIRRDVDALVAHAVGGFGPPAIVVNNAGVTHTNQSMLTVDEATFDRVFAVNVKAIYHMAQAVVPILRERRRGVILNVGSTAALRPRPGLVWYNASKAAVSNISKTMALELAPDGIRVNAICPVLGETGLFKQFVGPDDTPDRRARLLATIPLGRFSQPRDVAAAAVFLASDAAEFLTGIELPVDGGRSI